MKLNLQVKSLKKEPKSWGSGRAPAVALSSVSPLSLPSLCPSLLPSTPLLCHSQLAPHVSPLCFVWHWGTQLQPWDWLKQDCDFQFAWASLSPSRGQAGHSLMTMIHRIILKGVNPNDRKKKTFHTRSWNVAAASTSAQAEECCFLVKSALKLISVQRNLSLGRGRGGVQ